MIRRISAMTAFVAIVALAFLLLYRVWVHHTEAGPYVDDDRSIVSLQSMGEDGKNLRSAFSKSLQRRAGVAGTTAAMA